MSNCIPTSISFKVLLLSVVASAVSLGAVIYDTGTTTFSNPSFQTGRLSRSGIPSDWSSVKAFPGTINPTISYDYETFAIPASPFQYLQISFFDVSYSVNLFASAYLNSYSPSQTGPTFGLDKNYLGDAGASGDNFGNPSFFQVKLPNVNISRLLVLVNDTSPIGAGLTQPFEILVEGFYDTEFNDTTAPAPEPTSIALTGGGFAVAGLIGLCRRKRLSS